MTETRIRRAREEDRSLIGYFHRRLYVDVRGELSDPNLEPLYAYRDLEGALRDDVDALLRNPRSIVLLAECGDEPVGYITGHVETDRRRVLSTKGVVEDWYVEADLRRRGLATQLFDALLAEFRRAGCEVVESMTWPTNHPARAIHERLGFQEIEVKYRMRLDGA